MKKFYIGAPLLLVLIYIFSAIYLLHQIHKGIYYNDKKLIKKYVEWDELRNNFDVVLLAVKADGKVLEFASESLRDNKEIVVAAISGDACYSPIGFAS